MIAFVILAAVMVLGAVGVITLRQPVHAALSLVGTLMALAVTYVTLNAHFLAAIQVIVYAGAIMVLFLFVIMLLNVQGGLPGARFRWMKPVAFGAAALVAVGAGVTFFAARAPLPPEATVTGVLQGGNAGSIAEMLFSDYLLAFHLVGVLLMTGIIAAVSLVQRAAPETRPHVPVRASATRSPPRRARAGRGGEVTMVPTEYYLVLSAVLFAFGTVGVLTRRSAIMIFLSVELLLNAANLSMVAFARQWSEAGAAHAFTGQTAVFIVLAIAAAEVAVGLGILVAIFRNRVSTDVDELSEVRA